MLSLPQARKFTNSSNNKEYRPFQLHMLILKVLYSNAYCIVPNKFLQMAYMVSTILASVQVDIYPVLPLYFKYTSSQESFSVFKTNEICY